MTRWLRPSTSTHDSRTPCSHRAAVSLKDGVGLTWYLAMPVNPYLWRDRTPSDHRAKDGCTTRVAHRRVASHVSPQQQTDRWIDAGPGVRSERNDPNRRLQWSSH